MDVSELTQQFSELTEQEEKAAARFLEIAGETLEQYDTRADVRKFDPATLPTLYTANEDAGFRRQVERTQEHTDELWSGVLDAISEPTGSSLSQLCFNFENSLIRKLSTLRNEELIRRSVEMLYVQALLLGHYPLKGDEMLLLSDGLSGLIELTISHSE